VHVYQTTRPRSEAIKAMVGEFPERVCNGRAEPLLVHLINDRRGSQEDLEEVARRMGEAERAPHGG
jgi:predicted transcriptional regulator